jgi:beta-phosphoglucomutase-like phosphatase (HAD superfamily)
LGPRGADLRILSYLICRTWLAYAVLSPLVRSPRMFVVSRVACRSHLAAVSRSSSMATVSRPVLRGVIFDMDGTLTKPNLDFTEMYRRCGVDPKEDILAAIAAMPPAERAAAHAVVEEMEAEGRRTLELMPGAVQLARWLEAHGVPTAMVTRNTAATVAHLHTAFWEPAGLPAFSPAVSRDDASLPPKPDPAALASIAAAWGVPLGPELLMVGDSVSQSVKSIPHS